MDAVQATFRSVSRKTPQLQAKVDKVLTQWNSLWNSSHLYIERSVALPKFCEIGLKASFFCSKKIILHSLFLRSTVREMSFTKIFHICCRLKCVEIVLTGLDDCNNVLSEFELKLAAFQEMPSELDSLVTVSTFFFIIRGKSNERSSSSVETKSTKGFQHVK